MDFKQSETKKNLMRAFAGKVRRETVISLLRRRRKNRKCRWWNLYSGLTAKQEEAHAAVFYQHLKELSGETVHIDGGYPVVFTNPFRSFCVRQSITNMKNLTRCLSVWGKALEEGFPQMAASFHQIAGIEKTHGDRFGQLANLLEENKLFINSVECKWMCLNCGFIFEGKEAPQECPVCQHDRGFFIRLELAPYTAKA